MLLHKGLIVALALGGTLLSASIAQAHPQAIGSHDTVAAVPRSFYIQGPLLSSTGSPSLLAGLAAVNVDSSGTYSGTLTTVGTHPATLAITGTVSPISMTVYTTLNGAAISVSARSVADTIGDRGNPATLPATTQGLEYAGAVTTNGMVAGYVSAIDTSIMRSYSFAATIKSGPDRGASLNASLYLLLDRAGELHGYLQQDISGYLFPLLSGTLGRGRFFVHVDLMGGGQIVGAASRSKSFIPGLVSYQGTFGGPGAADSGVWLSAPPEH